MHDECRYKFRMIDDLHTEAGINLDTFGKRLKFARISRGFKTATDAATKFHWTKSSYINHEADERLPRIALQRDYAKKLRVNLAWLLDGVPPSGLDDDAPGAATSREEALGLVRNVERLAVRWTAEAGTWREVDINDGEPPAFYVAMSEKYPGLPRFLVEVRGDSMTDVKIFDGDFVIAVDWTHLGGMADGQIVVAQRIRDGGHTIETTIKELRLFSDRFELVPRSPNPKHKPIIVFNDTEADDGIEVRIIGLVDNPTRRVVG